MVLVWLFTLLGACAAAGTGAVAPAAPATHVSVGQSQVCVARKTGEVACWGELGSGLEPLTTTPVEIAGIGDAIDVSVGSFGACARRRVGPVVCWGADGVPAAVPGSEGATDLVAGEYGPCVVIRGEVSCVEQGRLVRRRGLSDVLAVGEPGYGFQCAATTTGEVQCAGELEGLGLRGESALVPDIHDALDVVTVDQSVVCAVLKGGRTQCFGTNLAYRHLPPAVADQIVPGCVRAGGEVSCWDNVTETRAALGGPASDLSCGAGACCAVVADGVWCWGDNRNGRLGDGIAAESRSPLRVNGLPTIRQLAVGGQHSMALGADGSVYLWGLTGDGPRVPALRLGHASMIAAKGTAGVAVVGRTVEVFRPEAEGWRSDTAPELDADIRAVTLDDTRAICVALVDGTTRCLFHGGEGDGYVPRWETIRGMVDVTTLSSSGSVTCGSTGSHSLVCTNDERFAASDRFPEGAPNVDASVVPGVRVRQMSLPFLELATGEIAELSLDEGRWKVTIRPDLAGFEAPRSGGYRWSPTCALSDRRVSCWSEFGNDNALGILGRETTAPRVPGPVDGDHRFVEVVTGDSHACALDEEGGVWCWGSDVYGQLGRGRQVVREIPAPVVGL